jgi:hypothetical protein
MPERLQVQGLEAGVDCTLGQQRVVFSDGSTLEMSRAQLDAIRDLGRVDA